MRAKGHQREKKSILLQRDQRRHARRNVDSKRERAATVERNPVHDATDTLPRVHATTNAASPVIVRLCRRSTLHPSRMAAATVYSRRGPHGRCTPLRPRGIGVHLLTALAALLSDGP
ncbi:hypothetical protein MRX96_054564 [Rhipicephalus microplus]